MAAAGPMLFEKKLTKTDVENRLTLLPEHLSELPGFGSSHQVDFVVKDIKGKLWEFTCSKRMKGQYDKPVISSGWMPFLHGQRKPVQPGDKVIFYRSEDPDAHLAIRLKRKEA